jgi:hypothetical protein
MSRPDRTGREPGGGSPAPPGVPGVGTHALERRAGGTLERVQHLVPDVS